MNASLRTASVWWASSYLALFLAFDLALPLPYFFGLEAVFAALFLCAFLTLLGDGFSKWRATKKKDGDEHKADLKFRIDVIVPDDVRWFVPVIIGLGVANEYIINPPTLANYFVVVPISVLIYVPIRIGIRAARF